MNFGRITQVFFIETLFHRMSWNWGFYYIKLVWDFHDLSKFFKIPLVLSLQNTPHCSSTSLVVSCFSVSKTWSSRSFMNPSWILIESFKTVLSSIHYLFLKNSSRVHCFLHFFNLNNPQQNSPNSSKKPQSQITCRSTINEPIIDLYSDNIANSRTHLKQITFKWCAISTARLFSSSSTERVYKWL
jgi:hypothetical protein